MPQYWHALYMEVLWSCWCSVVSLWKGSMMWPHLPASCTLKTVNTMYGETVRTRLDWNPLRWSYAFCRARGKREDMNQVLGWTTKGVAPALYLCWAARLLCSIYVFPLIFIQCRCCLFTLWKWLLCAEYMTVQFVPLQRTRSSAIISTKLSVLCRKVIGTECGSDTAHTATLCAQKAYVTST